MVVNRGVGVRQLQTIGTTPKEHRIVIAGLVAENAPGVPRSGLLGPSTSNIVKPRANMSYDILPCNAIIARSQDEGVYTPSLTGITNEPTIAAPSAGSRWDLVWIKQNDPEKGDTDGGNPPKQINTATTGVTVGDAAASPTRPENRVPAGALILSEHRIFAGTTATNQSPNTSTQRWRYTAARGAPIPVRNQAELSEVQPYTGMRSERLDLGLQCSWDGARWVAAPAAVRFGHMGRTDAFQPLSADQMQTVHMSAAQDLLGGVGFDAATSALTVPVTGRWSISCRFYATGRAGVQAAGQASIRRGSTTLAVEGTYLGFWKADHQDYMSQSAVTQHLVAGDKIFLQMQYGGSTWGTNGYNGSAVEIQYLGPSGSY